MRIIVRILGIVLLVLMAFGLFGSGDEPAGQSGTVGSTEAGLKFLDTLLLLGGGVSMIALSFYKRPRPSDTTVSPLRTPFVSTENDRPVEDDSHLKVTTNVAVLGYRERFAINPSVKILWDEVVIGEIGREGRFESERHGGGTLKFRSSTRSASIEVPGGANVVVRLAWDRISGKLLIHVAP